MSLNLYRTIQNHRADSLRGDTIIEVMFAIALFCLVAVISIAMMNTGVANAENSLELVVARNELNAQAEALRFIHSSYIAEKTLPLYGDLTTAEVSDGAPYQQYQMLWDKIVSNAIRPSDASASGLLDLSSTVTDRDTGGKYKKVGCDRIYEDVGGKNLLASNNAFILNTRNLSSLNTSNQADVGVSYVSASADSSRFSAAQLGARVIFETAGGTTNDSTTQFTDGGTIYNRVKLAEGIWVVAVTDGNIHPENSKYYDFYIEACWYGPSSSTPITQDTVIRLYNPKDI